MQSADTIDAFYLPTLDERDVVQWRAREIAGAHGARILRWPELAPAAIARIARHVAGAAHNLREMPVRDIVSAIDKAVAAMRDDAAAWALLCDDIAAVTGYSREMSRYVLDRMARDWNADALNRLITAELGSAAILDGFASAQSGMMHAVGPRLSMHIFSGNVPGVAVTSMIRALIVKSAVFGKTASGEPILAAAFAQSLARISPAIADAVAVTYWTGGVTDMEGAVFEVADAVIHYGGQASLDDVRRRLPSHTRLIEHGPKISFGMISRDALDALTDEFVDEVALAVATFDQQGCVSPHVLYIENGSERTAGEFALSLGRAFERLATSLPMGAIGAGDAAAIRGARDSAEFRAIAGEDVEAFAGEDLAYTIVLDRTPAFAATCLNRTVTIHPVDRLSDVLSIVAPFGTVLQSVALAAPDHEKQELATLLARIGITRITSFRDLPWPPPEWHHDGRGPLLELLRFADLE